MKGLKKIHIKSLILSLGFLLVIFLHFFDYILCLSTDEMAIENRKLAEKPELDITSLDYFPAKYDAWFNDHFHFRNELISFHAGLKLNIFGISPFKKVAKGKDGWLFNANEYLEDYRNRENFSQDDLKKITRALAYRKQWLSERGVKLYMAIAPNKTSIYEEYIPDFVFKVHRKSKLDQLKEYLSENSDFQLIDVRDELMERKKDDLLYYKTDPHWNNLGSFIAYQKIMKTIQIDFPQIEPLTLKDFFIQYDTIKGKVLAQIIKRASDFKDIEVYLHPGFKLKSKYGVKKGYPVPEKFSYPNEFEIVRYIPGSKQPPALLIRDSFTNALRVHFDETFSHTLYIWDKWQYQLNKEIVENEKPDILLYIIVERNLSYFLDNIEDFEVENTSY